jgi:hypothetical protein
MSTTVTAPSTPSPAAAGPTLAVPIPAGPVGPVLPDLVKGDDKDKDNQANLKPATGSVVPSTPAEVEGMKLFFTNLQNAFNKNLKDQLAKQMVKEQWAAVERIQSKIDSTNDPTNKKTWQADLDKILVQMRMTGNCGGALEAHVPWGAKLAITGHDLAINKATRSLTDATVYSQFMYFKEQRSIMVLGPSGSGKHIVATAIAHNAQSLLSAKQMHTDVMFLDVAKGKPTLLQAAERVVSALECAKYKAKQRKDDGGKTFLVMSGLGDLFASIEDQVPKHSEKLPSAFFMLPRSTQAPVTDSSGTTVAETASGLLATINQAVAEAAYSPLAAAVNLVGSATSAAVSAPFRAVQALANGLGNGAAAVGNAASDVLGLSYGGKASETKTAGDSKAPREAGFEAKMAEILSDQYLLTHYPGVYVIVSERYRWNLGAELQKSMAKKTVMLGLPNAAMRESFIRHIFASKIRKAVVELQNKVKETVEIVTTDAQIIGSMQNYMVAGFKELNEKNEATMIEQTEAKLYESKNNHMAEIVAWLADFSVQNRVNVNKMKELFPFLEGTIKALVTLTGGSAAGFCALKERGLSQQELNMLDDALRVDHTTHSGGLTFFGMTLDDIEQLLDQVFNAYSVLLLQRGLKFNRAYIVGHPEFNDWNSDCHREARAATEGTPAISTVDKKCNAINSAKDLRRLINPVLLFGTYRLGHDTLSSLLPNLDAWIKSRKYTRDLEYERYVTDLIKGNPNWRNSSLPGARGPCLAEPPGAILPRHIGIGAISSAAELWGQKGLSFDAIAALSANNMVIPAPVYNPNDTTNAFKGYQPFPVTFVAAPMGFTAAHPHKPPSKPHSKRSNLKSKNKKTVRFNV